VARVCSVIERHRQIRLLGERAEPFTVLIDEATKLPCRQFEFDQSERRITPSAGLNQLVDSSSLASPGRRMQASAMTLEMRSGVSAGASRSCSLSRARQSSCFGSDNMTSSQRTTVFVAAAIR